jgi:hypothetical protein
MDEFEALYQKYQDGTASAEEVRTVTETVRDARKFASYKLKDDPEEKPAEPQIIYRDKPVTFADKIKSFFKKLGHTLMTILIVVLVLAVLWGISFARATAAAKARSNVTQAAAEDAAMAYVRSASGSSLSSTNVSGSDRRLVYCWPLSKSYYVMVYQISTNTASYTIGVDLATGLTEPW